MSQLQNLKELKKIKSKENIYNISILFSSIGIIGCGYEFANSQNKSKKQYSFLALLILSIIILITSIVLSINISNIRKKAPGIYDDLLNKYNSSRSWSQEDTKAAINAIINEMKKVRIRHSRKRKNHKGYTISTYSEINIRKFLESPNTLNITIYKILLDLNKQIKQNPSSNELREPIIQPSIPNELKTKKYD